MRTPFPAGTIALALVLASCGDDPTSEPEADAPSVDASDTTDVATDTGTDISDTPDEGDVQDDVDVDVEADVDAEPSDATDTVDAIDAVDADVDVEPPPDPLTASWCYRNQMGEELGPDYDQFTPIIGTHCRGTDHQDITGIEKVVFVGDSITTGTPPTLPEEYYRSLMEQSLRDRFGEELEVANYSAFGRRVDDLLQPPHQMLIEAFPDVEPKTTLLIFTIGGNDVFAWAEDAAEGKPIEEIEGDVDAAIQLLSDAMDYLDDDERFPNGLYVAFSNVYEYTDGTGDTASCALAEGMGLGEEWSAGRPLVVRFNEAFMAEAVEHQFDLVFMLEHFCGHGFRNDDETGQCYRGPEAERWLDFTCIHPTPAGHGQIHDLFMAVVDE